MNRAGALLMTVPLLALTCCGPGGTPDEPPDPVSVSIIEASASVEAGTTFQFHFSVSNTTNRACSWSVNDVAGGNATVGTITADGLYAAPAAVPNPSQVTVKAVAAADATKSDTAVVTITVPPPFTISPGTATVPAGGTRQFTTTADVDWSVEGAAGNGAPLGEIGADGLFTAPLSPPLDGQVTIVAASKSDTSVRATAVATITFSDASLHGHYAFIYRATDAGEMMFAGGSFVADGQGGIDSGTMTMNSQTRDGGYMDVPITGAYQVLGDGRAYVMLQTATEAFPLRLALANDEAASLMVLETGRNGAGELERQDPSSFAAGLSGSYVFSYEGLGHVWGGATPSGQPVAGAGRLTAAVSGEFADFRSDVNVNGGWSTGGFGGSFSDPDPATGRGTIAIEGTGGARFFYYYLLSSDEALLLSTDWRTSTAGIGATGRLSRQGSGPFGASALAGAMALLGRGCGAIPEPTPDPYTPPWPAFSGAILAASGSGTFTGETADKNVNGTVDQGLAVSGSYDLAVDGRGTSILVAGGTDHAAFYLPAGNTAVMVGVDGWGAGLSWIFPQAPERPFARASLNGHYALALTGTLASAGTDVSGAILLNGIGDIAGVIDINAAGAVTQNVPAAGTYAVTSNGRGEMTISAGARAWAARMYIVDRSMILLVGTNGPFSGTLTRQY